MTTATSPLIPLWDGFNYKDHQTIGVAWMMAREAATVRGGMLCDEMGLGKTMQVLGLIKNTRAVGSTLLLAPKAVLQQWRDAAVRSKINVSVPSTTPGKETWDRPQPFFPTSPHTLYITNYDKVFHRPGLFKDREWGRIVLDEAHRIRNAKSILTTAVNKLSAPRRWAVTATPVVNSLDDMKTLLRFVGFEKKACTNLDSVFKLTEEAVLYRSMEDMRPILRDLPNAPLVRREELDFLTEDEQHFYQGIQGAIVRRWRALEADGGNQRMKLLLLMRLRQISLHPQVYINAMKRNNTNYVRRDWSGDSTKFVALRRKIESAPTGARWIIFCQFHDEIDLLEAYLENSPAIQSVYKYDGRQTIEQKDATIQSTRDEVLTGERHQVLLLQLHSGGVGLNLQHFNKIIFLSPWWTAALMDQAIGRAVRIGQTDRVEVTHMMLKEEATLNIDAYMTEAAERKRGLCQRILSRSYGRPQPAAEDNDRDSDSASDAGSLALSDGADLGVVGEEGEDPQ
jgi:SNF2 family DNA or RNA helicase